MFLKHGLELWRERADRLAEVLCQVDSVAGRSLTHVRDPAGVKCERHIERRVAQPRDGPIGQIVGPEDPEFVPGRIWGAAVIRNHRADDVSIGAVG